MKVYVSCFIIFFFFLTPFYAKELPTEKSFLQRYFEALDTQAQPLGNAFLWVVDGADTLFSVNREEVETLGRSHATIRFSGSKSEGESTLFGIKLKAHVSLPKTKDRLKLVFSSDSSDDYVKEQTRSNPKEVVENQDYLLGLRFFRPQEGIFKYYFQGGVKLHSPIDPYVRFVMSYEPQWFEPWDFLAKNVVSYFYHQKLQTKTSVIWTKELWPKWFVSHYDAFYYDKEEERYETVHAITIEHALRAKQRIGLDLSAHLVDNETKEYGLDYYNIRLGNQKQITDAFSVEAVPSFILEKDEDFEPKASFRLNLLYKIGRY